MYTEPYHIQVLSSQTSLYPHVVKGYFEYFLTAVVCVLHMKIFKNQGKSVKADCSLFLESPKSGYSFRLVR